MLHRFRSACSRRSRCARCARRSVRFLPVFLPSQLQLTPLVSSSLAGGASDHIPIVIDIERAALTGSKEEGGSKEEKKVEDTKEEENEEKADETAK